MELLNKIPEISEIKKGIITLTGNTGFGLNHVVDIQSKKGSMKGIVLTVSNEETVIIPLGNTLGLPTNCEISSTGRPLTMGFSKKVQGRIFNGIGMAIDNKGSLFSATEILASVQTMNPLARAIPSTLVRTGLTPIDVYNSAVQGQKLPIVAYEGEDPTPAILNLMGSIHSDAIIYGGIGMQFDAYHNLRNGLLEAGQMNKTTLFMHQDGDPIAHGLLVPEHCLATARQFMEQGKDVVCVLDDMTTWAEILRSNANAQDMIPSKEGFPGDLYSQLARVYEMATQREKGGSITLIPVHSMESIEGAVIDNALYITEGQLIYKGDKIILRGSLSRLKQSVNNGKQTRRDHRAIIAAMHQLLGDAEDAFENSKMGSAKDEKSQRLIKFRTDAHDVLQNIHTPRTIEEGLNVCWTLFASYFSKSEVNIPQDMIEEFWPEGKRSH